MLRHLVLTATALCGVYTLRSRALPPQPVVVAVEPDAEPAEALPEPAAAVAREVPERAETGVAWDTVSDRMGRVLWRTIQAQVAAREVHGIGDGLE